ncbi:uncharacterized protein LOC115927986 [Strongylocentrotus purpuratus]|uniref:Uncharacterized protein n=1 Tax=Strongylocentrotus purpuratus TaxID=7668 RepID=A0A7M7PEJ7_STRPU|nr:uncharacterized protein LOC115927986 [Strongylocentrotus purpuratus]
MASEKPQMASYYLQLGARKATCYPKTDMLAPFHFTPLKSRFPSKLWAAHWFLQCSTTSTKKLRVKCKKLPQHNEHPIPLLPDTSSVSVSAGSSSLFCSTSDQAARVKFTQEEKEAVQKLFQSWIEKGDMPRIGVVRDIVKQNKKVACCLSNRSFLQVRDRVRNAIKAQTKSTSM